LLEVELPNTVFVENRDYVIHKIVEQHPHGAKTRIEYYGTLSMRARRVSLLVRRRAPARGEARRKAGLLKRVAALLVLVVARKGKPAHRRRTCRFPVQVLRIAA